MLAQTEADPLAGREDLDDDNARVQKREKRNNILTTVLCCILFVAAIGCFWFRITYSRVEVVGDSMEQTLFDGDKLYLRRHSDVARGDIVVIDVSDYPELFQSAESTEPFYIIKRVIAIAGDRVKYHNGNVWLKKSGEQDYTLLNEDYAYVDRAFHRDFETEVKEDEVFFLGDNRRVSLDSSRVGCLPLQCVVGVVAEWSMPKHIQSEQ